MGIYIPRTTYEQIKEGIVVDKKEDLQLGDLLFFGTLDNPYHVGIYIGKEKMIEAPHTGANVREVSIDRKDYLTARRITKKDMDEKIE